MKTTEEYLKYKFSEEELKELADNMARTVSEKHGAEDHKKSVMASLKSELDTLDMKINNFARRIQDGYEMRYIKCEVTKDFKAKKVKYERLDTGEFVKERDMTTDERRSVKPAVKRYSSGLQNQVSLCRSTQVRRLSWLLMTQAKRSLCPDM